MSFKNDPIFKSGVVKPSELYDSIIANTDLKAVLESMESEVVEGGYSLVFFSSGELSSNLLTTLQTIVRNYVPSADVTQSDLTSLINQINTILTNNPTKQVAANTALRVVLLATFDKPTLLKILAAIQQFNLATNF